MLDSHRNEAETTLAPVLQIDVEHLRVTWCGYSCLDEEVQQAYVCMRG